MLSMQLFYPDDARITRNSFSDQLYDIFEDKTPQKLEDLFTSFFEGIPHQWYKKNPISQYEGYYNCLFYTAFNAIGFDTRAESSTLFGDIDLTVFADNAIYIFEFKMIKSAQDAMQQIHDRGYYKKYLNDGKDIFLIGIEFDHEKKNISDFKLEKLKQEV